jgi:hypothetical protein
MRDRNLPVDSKLNHFTDDQQRRSRQPWGELHLIDAANYRSLIRGGRARNDGARCATGKTCCFQFVSNLLVIASRHVDHDCGPASNQLAPISLIAIRRLMSRDQNQCGRGATVSQRNFSNGRGSQSLGHSRHDLVRDACLAESFNLFACSSEDHGVAGFQSDDL